MPSSVQGPDLVRKKRPSWDFEENGSPAGCEKAQRVSLSVGKRVGPQSRPVE